ncbi:WD40 repeat-like protein [Schizopora paradoxa]|uniref:WD40 repeat-like protein n=1 Tax=Schizopora paradoxa TaxID=27342 RepID=A0A0H2R8Y9_9AGAM|nr:WD40 repeat-like protein [Schizopora paradoxa]
MNDLGKHLAVQKNICIKFEDAKKLSKSDELQVLLGDLDSITAANPEKLDSLTRRWTLDSEILLFPGDIITFRVPIRKRRSFKNLLAKSSKREGQQEYQLTYEVVDKEFTKLSRPDASTIVAFAEDGVVLTLELLEGNIERIIEMASEEDLDPLLPERVQRVIDSSDTLWRNAQSLQGVLENLPVAENAHQVLENAIATLGNVHPLAKAILTALAIPYKMLRNEVKYKQKIKDMAETMRVACRCLMETRYHTKIAFAKDVFKNMLRLLRNAAVFIDIYCKKGRFQQVIGAQFSDKLDVFSQVLNKQKNDFQTAMILQISRDADSTAEDYLRRRLNPVRQDPLGDGCLAETRKTVLDRVREWLDNADSEKKILWIVGAPGAGKTTIATSIINELETRPYAKFFAKRDTPALSNARHIWPSIAFSLAEKHDGVKAGLMLALRDKRNTDVQDNTAYVQFENFVKGPLEMDLKESGSRPLRTAYPIVIIDALDECNSSEDWDLFLESLTNWSKLSQGFRLIVTSRALDHLKETLGTVSYPINLVTGDDVVMDWDSETNRDIRRLFREKFTKRLPRAPGWPNDQAIEELTKRAAGLFIWADMVINFVAPRLGAGGSDFRERLDKILADTKDHAQVNLGNRVDLLYARIVFEAFQHSSVDERQRGKRILATIVLAKEPLHKNSLFSLLPSFSDEVKDSTLRALSPIISANISEDSDDGTLRVCHKTVSDFVLDRQRSLDALKHLKLVSDESELSSYLIDSVEEENRQLALACLQLMHHKLSTSNITELLTSSQTQPDGFSYACRHCFEHVDGAGDSIMSNIKYLAGAIEVAYRSLERFAVDLDSENEKGIALVANVRGAIELAIHCVGFIHHEHDAIEALQKKLDEYTRNLGAVRGEFQIAMVLWNQASASDESSTKHVDNFLRRQIGPSDQTDLDNECAPGTRTSILSEAENWLENPGAPNILWIIGAPGAGKSAVAATLVNKVFPGIRLCAKLFAKRDFANRRDPLLFWRTLIYDFAKLHVGLRGSIMEALLGNSLLGWTDQSKHCRLLFRTIADQQCLPVVAVIDALDECSTEDHGQWRSILRSLSSNCKDFPPTFKLVVTSRDLPDIREAFSEVSQKLLLPTGSNTTNEAKSDIERVFRSKLADLPQAQASYWLSEEILPHLVERAAGSFIWAKMVVGLVQLNANRCLENIVDGDSKGGTEEVDFLYAKVLKETLGQLREEERFLEALPLNLNPEQVSQTTEMLFENLRSIITVDENQRVRIPHKSFTDFFLDEDRCFKAMEHLDLPVEERCTYLVRVKDDNATLAIACLTWMKDNLVFNAGRIPTSHSLNESLQQLEVEHMDLALVYTCRYWGEHLRQANRDDNFCAQARSLLRTFFDQKVLFWLEILSLEKAVTSAKVLLRDAREFLEGYDNDLAVFVDDVLKFVTHFECPIAMAAPHIYVSALPFSPSNSRIFQVYAPRFPNLFSVTSGRRENWGDAPITGDGCDNKVMSVSFFQDGSKLASASWDETVRIWDSRTGKAISPPFKHDSSVWSMAVSPDGKLIASGDQEGALLVWDSETGARKLNLTDAHSDIIRSVAFSPDGSRIVTGCSHDETVKVWDTASGELCLGPWTGHIDGVASVAFSPSGTLIASGSRDETIWIWDATTGKPHREPLVGHTSLVLCLAFTADGHYLASGSPDETIRLWNVIDGFIQTSSIDSGSPVYSISFLPKSEILASGHKDGFLHFWVLRAGGLHQLCNPIHGHTDDVNSITFSPDGLLLASGSDDKSIKIWTVPTSSISEASHVRNMGTEKPQYAASNLNLDHGFPVLSDESYIDEDGWLRSSRRVDASVLLWVPKENQVGFWFPRNTAVIYKNATKVDFTRFVYGGNWAECAKPQESEE